MAKKYYIACVIFLVTLVVSFFSFIKKDEVLSSNSKRIKLYWFVPDGLRAEPVSFKIYDWAREGKLPNLKKLMDEGSYGYSIPVFPGHTPTNYATLMTGTMPDVHGVADGAMRTEGYPLSKASKGGFSSQVKKAEPIWVTLERDNLLVNLLSIPGSTPPELDKGVTIKGRWGGWGIEIPAIIFHSSHDKKFKAEGGQNRRVFNVGSELTRFTTPQIPHGWKVPVQSFSPAFEVNISNWGTPLYALAVDLVDDKILNYDSVIISKDKVNIVATLHEGDWSGWFPLKINYEMKNPVASKKSKLESELSVVELLTQAKIKVIKLKNQEGFRIRVLYDNLNEFLIKPSSLYQEISKSVGPMVDFVDNYPPQLIYFKEDKQTFLEESSFSFDWHKKMSKFLINNMSSDVVIHSIYSPNQMLTSRWWMPYIDPKSPRYKMVTEDERALLWDEVLSMYKKIDDILGEVIKGSDENTYIALSSDHGAIPLYKDVRLNNFFASKGWLKYRFNKNTEELEIDWKKTRVIFLQMDNIYIHTQGFGSPYYHDSGLAYETLRNEVIDEIKKMKDENGISPLSQILKREEVSILHLPKDRTGDLVIANSASYNWVEDVTLDKKIFKESLRGGYKQAVLPRDNQGMWTPFVIKGPGVRKNHFITEPINHIDQYQTIMKLLNLKPSGRASGRVIQEILK